VSKIKVLHIIKSLGRGGAETLLVETIKHHNREQFEFHFIYFLPWKDQLVNELHSAGAGSVSCLKATSNIGMLLKVPSLVRYLKEQKIDIVHAHLPWAGIVARMACSIAGVPLIYTEHNIQQRYHWTTRWLNKMTFRWQQQVLAVSADVAKSIHENISTHVPVSVVLNGIDTTRFQRSHSHRIGKRQQLGIPEDALVVGTIAVFRKQKRLDLWLETFAKVYGHQPGLRGIIVGDGPLKNQLQEQAKSLGLEEVVVFSGLQTDTPAWISAFDVFMMTSDFEGLPLALLEAMSCANAIVATEAGGIPEAAKNEVHALLSLPGDQKGLEDNLARVCKDPALRIQLSDAARKRVEGQFSLTQMVHRLENLYTVFYP
jgi:glycosyltransferase involved in cell wall biosynthesis